MKKQVLILTICLAFTATTSLANDMPYPSPFPSPPSRKVKQNPVSIDPPAKKVKQNPVNIDPPAKEKNCVKPSESTCLSAEQTKKKFEDKMANKREDLYCKLGLTQEQKAKAEELDKANREAAKPLISKLRQERDKLQELKTKNVSPVEINKQKQQVKSAKRAFKAHFEASQKSFESILTECQLAKLKAIREERKAEIKKYKKLHPEHKHHCGKQGCPCPCSTDKK